MASRKYYRNSLEQFEPEGLKRRPFEPAYYRNDAHMYYITLDENVMRDKVISTFRRQDIWVVFNYQLLHSSPAGMQYDRTIGNSAVTIQTVNQLVHLGWHKHTATCIQHIHLGTQLAGTLVSCSKH
jgi:dTDP-4-amino-4,6-dideoxygalactose transaminase